MHDSKQKLARGVLVGLTQIVSAGCAMGSCTGYSVSRFDVKARAIAGADVGSGLKAMVRFRLEMRVPSGIHLAALYELRAKGDHEQPQHRRRQDAPCQHLLRSSYLLRAPGITKCAWPPIRARAGC